MANPQIGKAMKDMGLESAINALSGDSARKAALAESADTVYRVFEKRGQTLRVLITRGEPATQILVLSQPGK